MTNISFFNNEECVLINSISRNEKISEFNRQKLLDSLMFAHEVADDSDFMIIDLIEGLQNKINKMSDKEWDNIKMKVPFSVCYFVEDNMDEVPFNEF